MGLAEIHVGRRRRTRNTSSGDNSELGEEFGNRGDGQATVRHQVQRVGGERSETRDCYAGRISGEALRGVTHAKLFDCAVGCSPL